MIQIRNCFEPDWPGHSLIVCEDGIANVAPDRILLLPWGQVRASGGDMLVDELAANQIIDHFKANGVDLVVDYEHQTLGGRYARADGVAPAAGWINMIYAEPGVGIVGAVKWTPPGEVEIASKKYRYISPVALRRDGDGRPVALHSIGLTNKPAIVGMTPLVNSNRTAYSSSMQPAGQDRAATIREAGKVWDFEPYLQRLCGRAAFVDDSLRVAQATLLSQSERANAAIPQDGASGNRVELIRALAREFDSEPGLTKMTNRDVYVSGQLFAAGLPGLTAEERGRL